MYKALCVATLLAGLLVLAGHNSSAATGLTFPVVVAKGQLLNQMAPLQTTTIFTPTHDGMYRLSVYAVISRADTSSSSAWTYQAQWSDYQGTEYASDLVYGYDDELGQFTYKNAFSQAGGPVIVFEAKAGTPVAHTILQVGAADNSAYSIYYTVERLQ
ncbi:MAG: hypothetical protein WB729_04415 [Candidatus Sulfotelmatobacter sp.]